MPYRVLAANKLARFLSAVAHPGRIQIIEELGKGESHVSSLKRTLNVSHSNVSQHLAVLRAQGVVVERRVGRYVYYRLCSSELAEWLVDGLRFLTEALEDSEHVKLAIQDAKSAWTAPAKTRRKQSKPKIE